MFAYMLYRVAALTVLVAGYNLSLSHITWHWVLGIVVFIVGVELFSEATLLWDRKRKMPYRWDCPICRRKGKPAGCESSFEEATASFREHHNKTVHLMEP